MGSEIVQYLMKNAVGIGRLGRGEKEGVHTGGGGLFKKARRERKAGFYEDE